MCFSFYLCICYISQRNQSAFRLMHGIYYACYKSIWNSQQKHIKPIRKTKNMNLLENLLEAYFESASLSDYTHRYYPHAKRELSRIRADRNNKKKMWQWSLCCQTCILHIFHRRYSLHLLWVQALVGRGVLAAPGMSWRRHLLMDAAGLQPEVKSAGETVRFKGCSQAYLLWGKTMWLF